MGKRGHIGDLNKRGRVVVEKNNRVNLNYSSHIQSTEKTTRDNDIILLCRLS